MKNIFNIAVSSFLLISASSVLTVSAHELEKVAEEAAAIEILKLQQLPVKQLSFKEIIAKLDADSSGTLSWDEVKNSEDELLQNEFSKIDLNQDTEITEVEFNQFLEPKKIQR